MNCYNMCSCYYTLRFSIGTIYDNWQSLEFPKAPKASILLFLSIACVHVATCIRLNFEPWLDKFNPVIPELFLYIKHTYYSQRNSEITCWGLVSVTPVHYGIVQWGVVQWVLMNMTLFWDGYTVSEHANLVHGRSNECCSVHSVMLFFVNWIRR